MYKMLYGDVKLTRSAIEAINGNAVLKVDGKTFVPMPNTTSVC